MVIHANDKHTLSWGNDMNLNMKEIYFSFYHHIYSPI